MRRPSAVSTPCASTCATRVCSRTSAPAAPCKADSTRSAAITAEPVSSTASPRPAKTGNSSAMAAAVMRDAGAPAAPSAREHRVRAGTEGELRSRMQQPHPGVDLERTPQFGGALRHLDVVPIRVAQPEDAGRSVRPAARVADCVLLEHQHVTATAQRVRSREPEEPAADDHDVGAASPRSCDHANSARSYALARREGNESEGGVTWPASSWFTVRSTSCGDRTSSRRAGSRVTRRAVAPRRANRR